MKKAIHYIRGCDMALCKGKKATVYTKTGEILQTSPVEQYCVEGSHVYIETKNTIYMTARRKQVPKTAISLNTCFPKEVQDRK